MPASLKAEEYPLKKIFSHQFAYSIPPYQRPYLWTKEHANALLDDILDAQSESSEEAVPYFLGSIDLIKSPDKSEADVVDGQQRLTTLTILLAVLRDMTETSNNQTSDNRKDLDSYICQKESIIEKTPEHFRLTLRSHDQDFFRNFVQRDGTVEAFVQEDPAGFTDTRQKIHENAKYFWDKLSDLSPKARQELTIYLMNHCHLVVVSASDQSTAYRMFKVMNDRGLNLSHQDILKAEIIGSLPETERDGYTTKWENIEGILGREHFEDLFGHIRMLHTRIKAKKNLTDEFRKAVIEPFNDSARLIDDEIVPLAEIFQIILDASFEATQGAEGVNVPLKQLSHLENADWVPAAMAFIQNYRNDSLNLAQLLNELERLAFGLLLLGVSSTHRIVRYGHLLKELDDGNDLLVENSPLQLRSNERAEIIEALDGPLYKRKGVCMPVLLRLDSLMADVGVKYERKVISIEHVLPQNPPANSQWIEWFNDEDERQKWTQRLGNLVLLSRKKNTAAGNREFANKRDTYFKSGGMPTFPLTIDVLNEKRWTLEDLMRRHKKLKDMLIKHWRLE